MWVTEENTCLRMLPPKGWESWGIYTPSLESPRLRMTPRAVLGRQPEAAWPSSFWNVRSKQYEWSTDRICDMSPVSTVLCRSRNSFICEKPKVDDISLTNIQGQTCLPSKTFPLCCLPGCLKSVLQDPSSLEATDQMSVSTLPKRINRWAMTCPFLAERPASRIWDLEQGYFNGRNIKQQQQFLGRGGSNGRTWRNDSPWRKTVPNLWCWLPGRTWTQRGASKESGPQGDQKGLPDKEGAQKDIFLFPTFTQIRAWEGRLPSLLLWRRALGRQWPCLLVCVPRAQQSDLPHWVKLPWMQFPALVFTC